MTSKPTITNECETKPIVRRYYPRFESRFRFKRNPFDFAPEVNQWVQQVFDCSQMSEKRFKKIKVVTLYLAYFYPFCDDITRYEVLLKTYLLLFVFDDHTDSAWGDVGGDYEKAVVIWGQFSQALDKMLSPESFVSMIDWKPYSLQTFAAIESICQEFNGEQKRRFVKEWQVYCEGSVDECKAISGGLKRIDVNEKYSINKRASGASMGVQMIEYADNICLSDDELNGPLIRELLDNTYDCLMYVNDIFSFEKEYKEQHTDLGEMFNTVAFVADTKHCTIDEAMDEIVTKTIECEEKIFVLMNRVLKDPDISEDVKTFVERIEYMIGGNYRMCSLIDRYNSI